MPLGAGIDVSVHRRAPSLQCLWWSNEDCASRILASIEDPFVIDKILCHLECRGASQESATRRPGARAPPPAVYQAAEEPRAPG